MLYTNVGFNLECLNEPIVLHDGNILGVLRGRMPKFTGAWELIYKRGHYSKRETIPRNST